MYTIYHIPTVKIGCTEQPPQDRVKDQGYTNYEVLEEHIDIYIASDREIALQKQYGLPVDKMPYWKTIQQLTESPIRLERMRNSELYKEARKNAGTILSKKQLESGTGVHNFEVRSKAGKIGGQKNKDSGHIEHLGKKYGPINGKKAKESGQFKKMAIKGAKAAGNVIRTCPYCNKTIKGNVYFVWHGDNCKAKPQ